MLFDEDGQAYVEPPLLPEDTNVFWIVADYRRMYDTQKKMHRKMKKLAEKNSQMAHYNFFMRGRFIELVALTKRLAKELESRGYKLSSEDRTAIFDADCIATPKKKAGEPYV
jgi:hypothetical protein